MVQRGFSQVPIVAGIFILILIGGAYYLGTIKSTNTTITSVLLPSPVPTSNPVNSPTPTPDSCIAEKDNILSLVATFESLQQSKNSKGVLQLFAPPQLPQDVKDYLNLSGEDTNSSPRLYNNVSTNYNTLSYKVTQPPTQNSVGTCSVGVEEQRSYYGGPTNPGYLPPTSEEFTMVITKQDVWKIEQYLSQRANVRKGEFSGLLMEYTSDTKEVLPL